MVRYSLNYVSWKLRKMVATDLRTIYTAATSEEAYCDLDEFEEKWERITLQSSSHGEIIGPELFLSLTIHRRLEK